MGKKKLALFDVDGTLIDTTIAYNLVDELTKKGLFDPKKQEIILKNKKLRKENKISKEKVASDFYTLFSEGLKGKKVSDVEKIADDIASDVFKKHAYKNVPEGMNYISKRHFEPVLVSNSPGVLIRGLAKEIAKDARKNNKKFKIDAFGPEFEAKDGVYTGKLLEYEVKSTKGLDTFTGEHLQGKKIPMVLTRSGKYLYAKNVIEPKLGGEIELGMGDSEGDLWMLMKDPSSQETIKHPILITDKKTKLEKVAKRVGFKTFIRKHKSKMDVKRILEKALPRPLSEEMLILFLIIIMVYLLFFM